MRTVVLLLCGIAACELASPLMAGPIPVSASAAFTGFNNTWTFQYLAGAPDVYLQQITIDLSATDIRFDTAAGGFGSLGFLDVGGLSGPAAAPSATGAALDGGPLLTFTFANNFTPGNTFTFSADVDHPNPTLQILQNCTGLGPVAKAACNLANGVKSGINAGLLLAADTVLSAQMANASISFQFGGPNYVTSSVTDTLQAATLRGIINGLQSGNGLNSFASTTTLNDSVYAPEPSTLLLLSAGMLLLGWRSGSRA